MSSCREHLLGKSPFIHQTPAGAVCPAGCTATEIKPGCLTCLWEKAMKDEEARAAAQVAKNLEAARAFMAARGTTGAGLDVP